MRDEIFNLVKEAKEKTDLFRPAPIYEIGSFIVKGQEDLSVRPLFEDHAHYFGLDMRMGNGVDMMQDVMNMSFADGVVDNFISLDTLEHVENPFKMMDEIHRVLTSDGIAIVVTVMNFHIHAYPDDYWRPTPSAFRILCKKFDNYIAFSHGEDEGHPKTVGVICGKGSLPDNLASVLEDWGAKVCYTKQTIHEAL